MSLTDRLLKSVKINHGASVLSEALKEDVPTVKTPIPILNTFYNGDPEGGLTPGVNVMAGESQTFKTSYGLVSLKAFQDQYEDGICLFYDSENGATPKSFVDYNIDTSRVILIPITNVEELKFNIVSALEEIKKGEKVFIFVDSIGNLASKKEVEDAINENSAADMSRAKAIKSLFRIITPMVNLKHIFTYFIAHTYKTMGMFATDVISGGSGIIYSADTIGIVSRSKEKDGSDLIGHTFTIKVEKSRFVRRESKFPIVASFEDGVYPYSGLSDIAAECGIIEKVRRRGMYLKFQDQEIKERDGAMAGAKEFWDFVFANSDLAECIKQKYSLHGPKTETQVLEDDND